MEEKLDGPLQPTRRGKDGRGEGQGEGLIPKKVAKVMRMLQIMHGHLPVDVRSIYSSVMIPSLSE